MEHAIYLQRGFESGCGNFHHHGFSFITLLVLFFAVKYVVRHCMKKDLHKSFHVDLGKNVFEKMNIPHCNTNFSANDKALEVLNVKFAEGEITEEEYLRKKELIQK